MKRKSKLLQERNDSIYLDFDNMQAKGMKVEDILKELKKKYFLEENTIRLIIYDKNYLNRREKNSQPK